MGVTKDNARQCLNFDILHRIPLDLRKVTHLGLREFDVFQILTRELIDALLNLGLGELIRVAVPAIEFDRQFAHRSIAARLDIREDALHGIAHLTVAIGLGL